MRISAVVLALLISSSTAIRLRAEPAAKKDSHNAIDSDGRAKSESMPQYGGTATDDSKTGKMTHGEAKVNQKDVAGFKELSDTVLKNADTRKGSIHEHLEGKGLDPKSARELEVPGSAAKPGPFEPKGAKEVVEAAHDEIRKRETKKDEPAKPTQTAAAAEKDAKVVADIAKKHDEELKKGLKDVKAERETEEKEKKAADEKLKDDLEKAAGGDDKKDEAPAAKTDDKKDDAPPAKAPAKKDDAPAVKAAKEDAEAAEKKAKEATEKAADAKAKKADEKAEKADEKADKADKADAKADAKDAKADAKAVVADEKAAKADEKAAETGDAKDVKAAEKADAKAEKADEKAAKDDKVAAKADAKDAKADTKAEKADEKAEKADAKAEKVDAKAPAAKKD